MIFIIAWPCCPSTTVVSTSCDDSSTSTPPAPFSSRWAAQLSSNICEHIFFITATGFYPKSRRRNRYKNSGNSKNNPSSAPQLSFWQSALANDPVSLDWVDCKMGIEDNPFRPAKKKYSPIFRNVARKKQTIVSASRLWSSEIAARLPLTNLWMKRSTLVQTFGCKASFLFKHFPRMRMIIITLVQTFRCKANICSTIMDTKKNFCSNICGAKQGFCSIILDMYKAILGVKQDFCWNFWMQRKAFV